MKTALITGGSRRLGKAITLKLQKMGFNTIAVYNSTKPDFETESIKADLSKPDEAARIISQIDRSDILINNASIFKPGKISETTIDALEQHFKINLFSPVLLSKEFAKANENGQIINILDTKISTNNSTHTAYLLAKKALGEFTKMAAKEFGPNIRVNGIAPGAILPPPEKDEDYLDKVGSRVPLKRHGSADDITRAVEYLINNEYLTGQIIYVDGGDQIAN